MRRLRNVSARWRWAALATALVAAVFVVWFFFLRDGPQNIATPPQPRPAIGQTVTYGDYAAAIDSALSDVRTARSASSDDRKKAAQTAIATLEKVEGAQVGIRSAAAAPAEIDNTRILAELRGDSPDLDSVESSLSALSQALKGDTQTYVAGTLESDAANSELRRVLSDPAFDYERGLSPLQRLARWLAGMTGNADPEDTLWRWLISLVAGIAAGVTTYLASGRLVNRWVRIALSVVVALVVGLLFQAGLREIGLVVQMLGAVGLVIAAVAVALFVVGVRRAAAPPARPQRISELAAVLGMSAAEARRRAEESAGAGDFRSAIRYRCLGVLIALDEAGKLHFDRAATNREYLFRAPGDLQDQLQPMLSQFDSVWYGNAPATEEDWRDYTSRAAQIEASISAESGVRGRSGETGRSAA